MTSRRMAPERTGKQVDALVRYVLRERAKGAVPPACTWEQVRARCEDARPGLGSGLLARIMAAWAAWMNWSFPLLEMPSMRCEEQRSAGHNVHWTWLTYHRVTVRLPC